MTAALAAMSVIAYAERTPLPEGTLLNVNVPNVLIRNIKGFKLTRRGTRKYRDKFAVMKDPHGKDCYWIGGRIEDKLEEGTDVAAVAEGYVSVTPIQIDMTNYALLDEMTHKNVAAELDATLRTTGK